MRFTIGPSAGFVKTQEQAEECFRSPSNVIVLGSYTREERPGNPGNTYSHTPWGSLNSLGLPNQGIYALKSWLPDFLKKAVKAGKSVRVSLAAFSPSEYAKEAARLVTYGVRSIELNLGCPNVWGEDGQKPIASLNLPLMRGVLDQTRQAVGRDYPLAVKISPLVDPTLFAPVWKMFLEFRIATVVTMNTFPNALGFDESGKPLISVGEGLAGFAGSGVKLIALGQVAQFNAQRMAAPRATPKGPRIRIDGVGGIADARDVLDMRRAGADGVLIGTAFGERGPSIFGDIMTNLPDDVLSEMS